MIGRLEAGNARYDELTAEFARPEIASDPTQLERIGREMARLEPLVKMHVRRLASIAKLDEARELLDSTDSDLAELAQEERREAEAELEEIEAELRELLVQDDPDDDRNAIVEIRAGTGGDEAALFAAELLRMYARFAERRGLQTEVMSLNETGMGGVKEAILRAAGTHAFGLFRYESGVHRVQRVPVTEASGRIHTSAATVAVLPEAEEIELVIPESDLRIDVFRASGHGGQSVNTTDSAVRITHLPHEHRRQHSR